MCISSAEVLSIESRGRESDWFKRGSGSKSKGVSRISCCSRSSSLKKKQREERLASNDQWTHCLLDPRENTSGVTPKLYMDLHRDDREEVGLGLVAQKREMCCSVPCQCKSSALWDAEVGRA